MEINKSIEELTKGYMNIEFAYYCNFDSTLENYIKRQNSNNERQLFKCCLESLNQRIYESIITNGYFNANELKEEELYFLTLSKQFIKTNLLIGYLLVRADYFDCQVLIRKQLESATRLHELLKKDLFKLNGKTPNVDNTFNGIFQFVKRELSEFVHSSNAAKLISANNIDLNYDGIFTEESENLILDRLILVNMVASTALKKFQESKLPELNDEILDIFIPVYKVGVKGELINVNEIKF